MNPQMINMLFNAMKAKGITFPENFNMNDPNAILRFLMDNGKVTQEQYNAAYNQYRSRFGNMNNSQQK